MPWRKIRMWAGQFIGFSAIRSALAGEDRRALLGAGHLVGDDEHVLAILAPVAGRLPLARVHQLRRLHLLIAGRVEPAAQIGLELAPQDIALGMPEDRAVRLGLEVEQVHLLADLAMVALRRLLEPDEMRLELLPVQPAGAVDARELRVVLVAAPIGARDPGQLERVGIELAGRGEMRPAAEVEPAAGAVHGDHLVRGQLHHPFGLERLALLLEEVADLLPVPFLADQRRVGADDPPHLLLDERELLLGERPALRRSARNRNRSRPRSPGRR